MLEAERLRIISKLVQERSVVSVLDLVEILGASEATVRRDINGMAEAGVLRRIRGGVEALTPRHASHLVGTPVHEAGPQSRQFGLIDHAAFPACRDDHIA